MQHEPGWRATEYFFLPKLKSFLLQKAINNVNSNMTILPSHILAIKCNFAILPPGVFRKPRLVSLGGDKEGSSTSVTI